MESEKASDYQTGYHRSEGKIAEVIIKASD